MRIFLIAGNAESGKGEVATMINEFFVYKLESSVVTEYGKYLKNFAKELTNWDGNTLTKPRKYLQELGQTVRSINPNYLTTNMLQDIEIYKAYVNNIIIADVRMPEEIDEIRNAYDDVYTFYIENQFTQSKLSIEEQVDITETALENYNDFDHILVNDDKEKLKERLFKILEEIDK